MTYRYVKGQIRHAQDSKFLLADSTLTDAQQTAARRWIDRWRDRTGNDSAELLDMLGLEAS